MLAQFFVYALVSFGGPSEPSDSASSSIPWNARTVEHLYNRAAFGARREEIAEGLALGPEALVDRLIRADVEWPRIEPQLFRWEDVGFTHRQLPIKGSDFATLPSKEQVHRCKDNRRIDREQFTQLEARWLGLCARNAAPVRDRMTLFWHSLFTTSIEVNKRKFEIMNQFQWLRANALSSYAELLRGLVRDPAMLQYYDNTGNYKEHPNENFARELMELYSLGEGHYTEHDVREAARALTGYAGASDGTFEFLAERHDDGTKTILGRTGNFDGEQLVEILLSRPACARHIATRLIRYFEGVEPTRDRVGEYAVFLVANDWRIEPFLRKLFLDPSFYRDAALGARVMSPIEYYVSTCHKLGYEAPPAFAHEMTDLLGQSLYAPPTVKGWPEGLGWLETDTLLRRGNCIALLVGELDNAPPALSAADTAQLESAADACVTAEIEAALSGRGELEMMLGERSSIGTQLSYSRMRGYIEGAAWSPLEALLGDLGARGISTDAELVDALLEDWLSTPPSAETRTILVQYLGTLRRDLAIGERSFLDSREAFDFAARHLAYLVFSLPEAQLS
ncbi:MAG: DUF1800 domain-containing protein [Planctomycetes bacterium]|nr:DUF1800 domain-containing protein [Planctomycetota bacterium]